MTSPPAVSYAFQPMLSTRTGRTVAVEALARPATGTVHDLLHAAAKTGRLVAADVDLARGAVLAATLPDRRLPLHVNVLARTVTRPNELLAAVEPALRQSGRRGQDVTLEITPPFSGLSHGELFDGLTTLRRHGFHLALDGAGDGDLPLSVLAELAPDMIKLDAFLLRGLPHAPGSVAVVEALAHLSARLGTTLAAVGVESEDQLLTLSRLGVAVAQGNLLAAAGDRNDVEITSPDLTATTKLDAVTSPTSGVPLVADLMRPAHTMPESATSEEVRKAFTAEQEANGVVLVDHDGRPQWTVDRSRFLLAVAGPYGHALHASRPAIRHADPPRLIRADATGVQVLEAVGETGLHRTGDDLVVVDANGVCLGVVALSEVVRTVADAKVEQAAALNPLTRLPGTGTVAREIDRRIERSEMFVVSWLDVDGFKNVNDSMGFASGDELIRGIGRVLADAESALPGTRVAHVGGDDFLVVTDVDEVGTVAGDLVDRTWAAEGLPVTVSLASLVCAVNSVGSYREASRLLAPLKRRAKTVPASSWVLGRPGSDRVDVLRGQHVGRRERLSAG